MELILRKNEAEINENVAKGLLIVFSCVLLTVSLCWIGIFDIHVSMTIIMLGVSVITLIIPSFLTLKIHIYHKVMKYYIVAALAIMAGASYALFTFQAVIVFVVPTIIAAFYLDKKLLYFSCVITMVAIFVSHIITVFHMFLPWLEPFVGMKDIIQYGALPRCLQYCGCFLLILFMMEKYRKLFVQILPQKNFPIMRAEDDEQKKEYEALLSELTEREKSVFQLMISGYTNMQIADKLCLSNGTIKNYISVIYEKLGTKERNALILKYSRFLKEND
ncbi:MAG: helix-turn-helix transcriptional regulator [Clostridia bacterium]|nr:helix-turn-helix transcriptional regulator [Clostridia bacterium]